MLACLDSWPSSSCAYVVENELCDINEIKTETMSMTVNFGKNCKKTCGHCGKNPTDKCGQCFIIKHYINFDGYGTLIRSNAFYYSML